MKTTALLQKLYSYLAVADDKKVEAIYAIMETDIENSGITYTEDLKTEIDKRYADYKSGRVEAISAQESDKRIKALLKSKSTA